MSQQPRPPSKPTEIGQVVEVVDLLKSYVKQETIGPLKGLGRKVGMGLAGALMVGIGLVFLGLGLLRLIQTQFPRLAEGTMSLVSYAIVIIFLLTITGLAVWQVSKIERELKHDA